MRDARNRMRHDFTPTPMPPSDILVSFLLTSILITLAPGPDNLMVLGHSLARGRQAGAGIALGCALGCFSHTLWAALGVSALLAGSPGWFEALKLVGAAYLAWLGFQALRRATAPPTATTTNHDRASWRADLRKGFIANAVNPKVALFFLAFLPQFAHPEHGNVTVQMIGLGALFALQTSIVFGGFALGAAAIGRLLSRYPGSAPVLDRLAGILFIGLALRLALDRDPA